MMEVMGWISLLLAMVALAMGLVALAMGLALPLTRLDPLLGGGEMHPRRQRTNGDTTKSAREHSQLRE